MKVILETQRLVLREFDISDAEKMYDLNSDPEVIRYTDDPPFASVADAEKFLEGNDEYRKTGFGRWAVLLGDSNEFIGWCGLKLNEESQVDIGFRFFRSEWNKGYATESARACLNHGFNTLGMEEIIGRAAKANTASIRVLEKLKMKYWKTNPRHGIDDVMYYRLTKPEYNVLSAT